MMRKAAEPGLGNAGGDARTTESIISVALARGLAARPEAAGAELLKLIRENARLEAENARLKARVARLVGLDWPRTEWG